MEQITTFLHNGSIGDVWASLPSLKEYHRKTGRKVLLYLVNGTKAFYYDGAVHPTKNQAGEQVMLNEEVISMMIPLLKAQDYISDAKIWSNQPINFDLNVIRTTFVNMPYHTLSMWYPIVWPDVACDHSKQYIFVPDSEKVLAKDKIIITRSERYLNPNINYNFLKKYEDRILFVGTELEYQIFKLRFGLKIERLIISDFLELAQALKQCKFHLSNQTQAFQISEGLKIPRVVELCSYAPNVTPIGENAFYFYAQDAIPYYVSVLLGETPEIQKIQKMPVFIPKKD